MTIDLDNLETWKGATTGVGKRTSKRSKSIITRPSIVREFVKYDTSYSVGLRHTVPPSDYTELKPLMVPQDDYVKELKPFPTTNRTDFNWKFSKQNDPIQRSIKMVGVKASFMKVAGEKTKQQNVGIIRDQITEFKEKFKGGELPVEDPPEDLNLRSFCVVPGGARDIQTKLNSGDRGAGVQQDIYNTTTNLAYPKYTDEQVSAYKSVKTDCAPLIVSRHLPFDEKLFKLRFLDKVVPRKYKIVPHSGMQSESQVAYKSQIGEFKHQMPDNFIPYVGKQTAGDVIAVPGMYQTEYSHMGHNWSLRALL